MKRALTTSRTLAVMVARPSPLAAFCFSQICFEISIAGLRDVLEVQHVD